jgi:hypothetical protein
MKAFYGTKESAGCRSKPLAALQSKDKGLEVLKSTIMVSTAPIYYVHFNGELIGSVLRWEKDGDCSACMARETDSGVEYSEAFPTGFTGKGSLGIAVGVIIATHHATKGRWDSTLWLR